MTEKEQRKWEASMKRKKRRDNLRMYKRCAALITVICVSYRCIVISGWKREEVVTFGRSESGSRLCSVCRGFFSFHVSVSTEFWGFRNWDGYILKRLEAFPDFRHNETDRSLLWDTFCWKTYQRKRSLVWKNMSLIELSKFRISTVL